MATTQREVQKQERVPETLERTRDRRAVHPATDIIETPEAMLLISDMPGVDDKSVDITLEKNILTIEGRSDPGEPRDHQLTYSEYASVDYLRSFRLSEEIDRDHIEAVVKNGVLRLTLPKTGPAKTRKIEVKSNDH